MITPQKIETRLYELSKEIDDSHAELIKAEVGYFKIKAQYEIELAKVRLKFAHSDMKMTVSQREDQALMECANLHFDLAVAEATVRAERANAVRIKTQVDIARSIGTSVRSSMEVV